MALIEWKDSMSVNVYKIDLQHKQLINIINELNQAMSSRSGNQAIGEIIKKLISYSMLHFRTEEELFDRYGYPQKALHKKEHAAFTAKVNDFKNKFNNGSIALTIEVMVFLSDWLQTHIRVSDQKYSPFFTSKGES